MRKLNQNYIPFYRVFEEEMGGTFGFGKGGYANIKSPVKRLKGSERDIIDPLESVIRILSIWSTSQSVTGWDVPLSSLQKVEKAQGNGLKNFQHLCTG